MQSNIRCILSPKTKGDESSTGFGAKCYTTQTNCASPGIYVHGLPDLYSQRLSTIYRFTSPTYNVARFANF